ncbi:hypothetical protein JI743_12225 [Sphingopyxis sp. DHUNG17]|uniref:hypothetical protein n=1 Tax=Sphingopyxis jiangsuensis TaxID=2871171 RepID=UPI00191F372A|nr:hypothetical protein [Sphingopyxis lutea]MBL0769574.1 hypothetical protein [Sphingopyxis lutea]
MARKQVEKDYPDFVSSGWVGSAEDEGKEVLHTLAELGFTLEPRSGWAEIGYEVRLIELSMTGLWPEAKGHAQLARESRKLARTIRKSTKSVAELSRWQAVSVASMFTRSPITDHISEFLNTARWLETVADFLEIDKQPTKWASSRRREARLVLACKLAPLFESEFGKPARPRGGSEMLPDIRDEADWTKFYQGVAKLVLGEAETPDRQDILWEAAKPSEIPPDFE